MRDLQIVVIFSLLTFFITLTSFSALRILLGLPFIFLLPGYALLATLFPLKNDVDIIERFVLSISLSITISTLIGLLLNYSLLGIKPIFSSIFLTVFTIVFSIIGILRRFSLEKGSVIEMFFDKNWFIIFSKGEMRARILATISLILTILSLVVIENTPAIGYELSIYQSTPMVWIFLFSSTICGIGIIIYQAFSDNKNNFWSIGLSMVLINIFIILSLHALRGYFYYGSSDHILQIKSIRYIVSTGHFESDNLHPAINIFAAQICEICDLSSDIVAKYLPAFFSIFFMIFCVYLLAREVLPERHILIALTATVSILPFNSLHVQLYPHTLSVFLYPLILYSHVRYLKRRSWQFGLLLILFLILLPYSHPYGSFVMIFLLPLIELARIIVAKRLYNEKSDKIVLNPAIISFITFFWWISSFTIFGIMLPYIWSSIFNIYQAGPIQEGLAVVERLTWVEVIEYNVKMYGDNLVYVALSIVAGVIIFKKIRKREKNVRFLSLLFIFFITCFPVEFILMIGFPQRLGRVLNLMYGMVVSPILVGFAVCEIFKKKKIATVVVTLLFASTFGISILSVYHSPWIFSPSWHITSMDVKGADFFFTYRNSELEFEAMGIDPSLMLGKVGLIPAHFNYTYHKPLGESIAHDCYIMINKRCKLANIDPVVSKAQLSMLGGWGFDRKDFDNLENDSSVAKIYSNGEFDLFLVSSSIR
jgi:hypothetical protein